MSLSSNHSQSPKRQVLIVADRYWPYTNDDTLRLKGLSRSWHREGWAVTILTPRWHRSWPLRVRVEDADVVRLDQPPLDSLRRARFRHSLSQWLLQNLKEFDAVWCDAASGESAQAVASTPLDQHKPLIVRFDLPNSNFATEAERARPLGPVTTHLCKLATLVAVTSATAHQCLIQSGVPPDSIVRLCDWRVPSLDRSPSARRAARVALTEINHDLATKENDRLVVIPGELHDRWGLRLAIDALGPLLDQYPALQFWIHGDGPQREFYYELLQEKSLHRAVALPGMFSCIEAILQASDLCLFPTGGCGTSWLLPTCLLSEIPTLTVETPELAQRLGPSFRSLTFPERSPRQLRAKVEAWLQQPAQLQQSIKQVGGWIRRENSDHAAAGGLTALLRQLTSVT